MYNDEFSQYLVESTSNYFDRYGKMYGEGFDEYDKLDEELDELIDTLLDEGYSVEECVEAFAEMDEDEIVDLFSEAIDLHELNPYAPAGSKEAKKYAKATSRAKRGAERAAKVAAVKSRVKGKVQSAVDKAKSAAKAAVGKVRGAIDKPAGEYAAKRKLIASKSGKSKLTGPAIQMKQRTSAGRREVRGAVAKDIGKRALGKAQRAGAAVRAQASAAKREIGAGVRGAVDVAKKAGKETKRVGRELASIPSAAGKFAKFQAKKKGSAAKAGIKQKIGGAAMKVAKRMGVAEEMDVFDVVLHYILDEGYAVSFQEAYEIMTELDDDTIDDILEETGFEFDYDYDFEEGYKYPPFKKMDDKARKLINSPNKRDQQRARKIDSVSSDAADDYVNDDKISGHGSSHGYTHQQRLRREKQDRINARKNK